MKSFLDGRVTLLCGDSAEILDTLPEASVDSIVSDPPYHLTSIVKRFGGAKAAPAKGNAAYERASRGFMSKVWDGGDIAFQPEFWAKALRVLKPGGHVVAFGAPRNWHRLACAIEDAGFEIRDNIVELIASDTYATKFMNSLNAQQQDAFMRCLEESNLSGALLWNFGSGFPKSHDVSKGIDRAAGVARESLGIDAGRLARLPQHDRYQDTPNGWQSRGRCVDITEPATAAARQWEGWGTALKPAFEPIVLARKPLSGTVAETVLEHGTGAINIDGCRIEASDNKTFDRMAGDRPRDQYRTGTTGTSRPTDTGRWPANLLLDGSEEVIAAFPDTGGGGTPKDMNRAASVVPFANGREEYEPFADTLNGGGSAARFFYTSKADAHDRLNSKHPTVKPVDLMQWLCRLVCPKGGTILDPFAGTGTTGEAAWREGMKAILIEREEEYQQDIARRMEAADSPMKRAMSVRQRPKPKDDTPSMFDELAE